MEPPPINKTNSIEFYTNQLLQIDAFKKDDHSPLDDIALKKLNIEGADKNRLQGSKELRIRCRAIADVCPEALSIYNLKKHIANDSVKRIVMKMTGLILALKDGNGENLFEGFNEIFPIAELTCALKAQKSDLASQLNSIICTEGYTDEQIEKKHKDFLHTYKFSCHLFASGHPWHSLVTGVVNNYFFICNRGHGCEGKPGIRVYKYSEPKKLFDMKTFKLLTNRHIVNNPELMASSQLEKAFGLKEVYYRPMKTQKAGNCTYASPKTALFLLIATRFFHKYQNWEACFANAYGHYKKFSHTQKFCARLFVEGIKNQIPDIYEKMMDKLSYKYALKEERVKQKTDAKPA